MTKQFNKISQHLNLLRDIGAIKLSLLWFINWSNYDRRITSLLVQSVTQRFELLALTRGRLAAIDEFKNSRLAFTRWLCGRPLSGNVGTPITKQGLPKVIPKEVRIQLHKDPDKYLIKAIITCLSIGRYFKGGKPIDLEAITCTSSPKLPKDPEIILGLKKLGINVEQERPWEFQFPWVVTAGPNGPSISSSLQDLPKFNDLFRSQVSVLLPDLLTSIDKLLNWEKNFKLSKLMKLDHFKDNSLRKLSIKEDKEGKSRIFAIFDYWSQVTLSPLHDWSFSTLRSIPQDCTFNQAQGVTKIQSKKSSKYYYSYDLKSATDRFPIIFQERVLSLIFDKEYAEAWRTLMTREAFRLKGVEQPIKWEVGQPLGAKSSWGIFTLCHHLVVSIAAIRTSSDMDYVILGDDIVLRGYALAAEYKRIMNSLGVQISESKSHVSKDTFEFAKIWYHKGENVSSFPIVGVAETIDKPMDLACLFVFENPIKGYHYSIDPRSVSCFFSPIASWNTKPPRKAVWAADKVAWYFSFLSWLVTKDGGWAKYIAQSASLVVSPSISNSLFTQVVKEKWARQLDKTLQEFWTFGIGMLEKIRDLPPFKPVWDPKSYPGRMDTTGIAFSAPVQHVPIFAALQQESRVVYSDYIQSVLEDEDHKLTLEEIDSLKLPPRAQLKGFEPVRSKENIRTLSLISRSLKNDLMTKSRNHSELHHLFYPLKEDWSPLEEGATSPKSLKEVMTPAMAITHSGSLPWMNT